MFPAPSLLSTPDIFDLFCQARVKLQLFCDDFINSRLMDSKWKMPTAASSLLKKESYLCNVLSVRQGLWQTQGVEWNKEKDVFNAFH